MSQKYSSERIQKLVAFDKCRFHKLLQTGQYAISYLIVGGVIGTIVDFMFPKYEPELDSSKILFEVCLQSILTAIAIFYIRKVVKIIPYLFGDEEYCPYKKDYAVPEYQGDIILILVMVATQTNLLKKYKHLQIELRQKLVLFFGNNNGRDLLYQNIFLGYRDKMQLPGRVSI